MGIFEKKTLVWTLVNLKWDILQKMRHCSTVIRAAGSSAQRLILLASMFPGLTS